MYALVVKLADTTNLYLVGLKEPLWVRIPPSADINSQTQRPQKLVILLTADFPLS